MSTVLYVVLVHGFDTLERGLEKIEVCHVMSCHVNASEEKRREDECLPARAAWSCVGDGDDALTEVGAW